MLGTRRTVLNSVDSVRVPEWVTLLAGYGYDVQCAYDFRGVSSLDAATFIGDTPTVREEPVGGLVWSANGLRCDEDTLIDTGVKPAEAGTCYVWFTNADLSPVYYHALFGCNWSGWSSDRTVYILPYGVTGDISKTRWCYYENSLDTGTHTSGGMGVKEGVGYKDGVGIHTWGWAGTWDPATVNMHLGGIWYYNSGSYYSGLHYRGTIQGYWQTSDDVSSAHIAAVHAAWST